MIEVIGKKFLMHNKLFTPLNKKYFEKKKLSKYIFYIYESNFFVNDKMKSALGCV